MLDGLVTKNTSISSSHFRFHRGKSAQVFCAWERLKSFADCHYISSTLLSYYETITSSPLVAI